MPVNQLSRVNSFKVPNEFYGTKLQFGNSEIVKREQIWKMSTDTFGSTNTYLKGSCSKSLYINSSSSSVDLTVPQKHHSQLSKFLFLNNQTFFHNLSNISYQEFSTFSPVPSATAKILQTAPYFEKENLIAALENQKGLIDLYIKSSNNNRLIIDDEKTTLEFLNFAEQIAKIRSIDVITNTIFRLSEVGDFFKQQTKMIDCVERPSILDKYNGVRVPVFEKYQSSFIDAILTGVSGDTYKKYGKEIFSGFPYLNNFFFPNNNMVYPKDYQQNFCDSSKVWSINFVPKNSFVDLGVNLNETITANLFIKDLNFAYKQFYGGDKIKVTDSLTPRVILEIKELGKPCIRELPNPDRLLTFEINQPNFVSKESFYLDFKNFKFVNSRSVTDSNLKVSSKIELFDDKEIALSIARTIVDDLVKFNNKTLEIKPLKFLRKINLSETDFSVKLLDGKRPELENFEDLVELKNEVLFFNFDTYFQNLLDTEKVEQIVKELIKLLQGKETYFLFDKKDLVAKKLENGELTNPYMDSLRFKRHLLYVLSFTDLENKSQIWLINCSESKVDIIHFLDSKDNLSLLEDLNQLEKIDIKSHFTDSSCSKPDRVSTFEIDDKLD